MTGQCAFLGVDIATLLTVDPAARSSTPMGHVAVCVHEGDLCLSLMSEDGVHEIVGRLSRDQADTLCGLIVDCMIEMDPKIGDTLDHARLLKSTLQ